MGSFLCVLFSTSVSWCWWITTSIWSSRPAWLRLAPFASRTSLSTSSTVGYVVCAMYVTDVGCVVNLHQLACWMCRWFVFHPRCELYLFSAQNSVTVLGVCWAGVDRHAPHFQAICKVLLNMTYLYPPLPIPLIPTHSLQKWLHTGREYSESPAHVNLGLCSL